ncbi:MAG: hypothetical protein P4M13_07925 [Alphaproteobacteria bacterium]|nr:hypothetical protein [Alphaproteobacteria bacterium]
MRKALILKAFAALMFSAVPFMAMAQASDPTVPGHPRINEIDRRLENQQNRTDTGVANGQINANQAARDTAHDARVSRELSTDEAKNGGHITKAEQRRMNRQLNKNSHKIHRQRHKKTQ